jgi:hypothetical protein
MGTTAGGIHGNTDIRQTTRSVITKFFKIIRNKFTLAVAYCEKLISIAARPAPRTYEQATHVKRTIVSRGRAFERASAPGYFLVSICFGLLAICGIMLVVLFLQIRDMKVEIGLLKQYHAAMQVHLSQLEKTVQQKLAAKESSIVEAPPRHMPIALSNDDMKVIRSFIKVLPPRPGAQPKIHLGEGISDSSAVPVPELLISQVPKLRGARFLVDQNGVIIIIGAGSNRADAVIEPE